MKRLIILCLLTAAVVTSAVAQGRKQKSEWQVDKLGITYGSTISIVPIKLTGLVDKGTSSYRTINSHDVPDKPDYSIQDTLSMLAGITLQVGVNVPFYRTSNWSTGAKLYAGAGYHENVTAAEGAKGFMYDFPQFLYYRNYKGKIDYTLLMGYKYTNAALSYQLALAGVEFELKNRTSVRLHGSLNSYKYYMQFTDGRTKPAVEFRDFGISFIAYL